jgi:hypothetical protein
MLNEGVNAVNVANSRTFNMSYKTMDAQEQEIPRSACTPALAPSRKGKGKGLPAHLVGKGFKKGQSGNPSGRPKDVHKLASVARSYAPNAIDTIVEIMNDQAEHGKVRLTAATILLDRGYGKSLNQKDISVNVTGGDSSYIDALRIINSRPKMKFVNGEIIEDTEDENKVELR